MSKFSSLLKNLFWILVLVQIAPTLFKSIKSQYSSLIEPKTKVGVVTIKDTITSSECYVRSLKKFFEDSEIKAIVLKIESPGGVAGASQTIFNEIKSLKSQHNKYIVAFIENIAASGGYYVACSADHIISSPAAFIGSIGSYIAHPNFKELVEFLKVKYEIIGSGDYKTVGSPFLDLTDNQRKLLQDLSDNVYHQFIKDVAEQRPSLSADYKLWADGKIFTGQQALVIHLVDELGSQSTVAKTLKEKANIKGKIEWVKAKPNESLFQSLLNNDSGSEQELGFKSLIKLVGGFFVQNNTSNCVNY